MSSGRKARRDRLASGARPDACEEFRTHSMRNDARLGPRACENVGTKNGFRRLFHACRGRHPPRRKIRRHTAFATFRMAPGDNAMAGRGKLFQAARVRASFHTAWAKGRRLPSYRRGPHLDDDLPTVMRALCSAPW